jgi:hypothetical protein
VLEIDECTRHHVDAFAHRQQALNLCGAKHDK